MSQWEVELDFQRFIQPANPATRDTHVPGGEAGWVQTDKNGDAFIKVLWTSGDSGGWAVLYRFSKGYTAPAHKHLGAIHTYIISGRLQVSDAILAAGDYQYEANGVIHDTTVALEDTVYLNIADGPIVIFGEAGFQYYVGWEQMLKLQRSQH